MTHVTAVQDEESDTFPKLKDCPAIKSEPGLITISAIYFQIEGIVPAILSVFYCWLLQVGSILIMASIPNHGQPDFPNRAWSVFVALSIFMAACMGEFISENLLNLRLLLLRGCYVKGQCFGEVHEDPKWFEFDRLRIFCFAMVVFDCLIWVLAVVVGARLIVLSESFESVILNSLAGIFVIQVDDILSRMIIPTCGEYARNTVYIKKFEPHFAAFYFVSYCCFMIPIIPTIGRSTSKTLIKYYRFKQLFRRVQRQENRICLTNKKTNMNLEQM